MRVTNRNQIMTQMRNMNKTLGNLSESNNRMSSQRKLNHAYENVADATRAMRVRKAIRDKDFYMRNGDETVGRIDSADGALQTAVTVLRKVTDRVEQGLNGTFQDDDRQKIAAEIESLQGEILSLMNSKYADQFVFGAAGGPIADKAPFANEKVQIPVMETVNYHMENEDGNKLFLVKAGNPSVYDADGNEYRPGDTISDGMTLFDAPLGGAQVPVNNTNFDEKLNRVQHQAKDANGNPQFTTRETLAYHGMPVDEMEFNKNTGKVEWYAFDSTTGAVAFDKATGEPIREMPYNATNYVDIGLGYEFIKTKDGETLNPDTVVPYTFSGVEMFGMGKTDGMSNNLYSAMGEIVTALKQNDLDALSKHLDHLPSMRSTLLTGLTEAGTRSNFITDMRAIHENDKLAYQTKQKGLEATDLAEEAMHNKNHEMAWMVTLQLGSKVLPSSLFDFIR